ncbi:flagellar biosynthesis anti-sigma factor FlgM [Marinobacter zhejiangensis]|uniref:Negative regulator of flagellin synthesis n=1 Tax=Marinobacter zhejiangensis TaxID=488535 RepID=A0A1I4PBW2_9GAMM|nr:flagellar biosynthesis anti-sigma factor FlgM [Marinobacter zhejiangensis]SFM25209.1 anti-sigma-28 factor, FlgM family [Marinobacter zhejiangensis]
MSVDFNGIGSGQVNSQKASAAKPDGSAKTPQSPVEQAQTQSARGESVKLSAQAKNLKQLEERLNAYPEMDDARIEQIKSALADGSYKVDAEKLAQKMLDMDKSIFG